MFFRNAHERRGTWDYRDYCDHRTRQKRRIRLWHSIMTGLLFCLLLALGLGAAGVGT